MAERYIEYPSVHNTFTEDAYGVFEYGTYEDSSVLAGQEKRSCLGTYATLSEAQIDWPDVKYVEGSGYVDRPISRTPPEWFDESAIGERWND